MKKKFLAIVCSFALAMTLPVAAFAEGEGDTDTNPTTPTEEEGTGDEAADPNLTITEEDGVTTIEIGEDAQAATYYTYEDGEWNEKPMLESITIKGAEGVDAKELGYSVTSENSPVYADYDADAVKEYVDYLNQVEADKGQLMFSFELTGDVPEGEKAIVTFQLDKDEWGGKVVTYCILHSNGDIQKKVVRVHADGTVRIDMESFSIVTFLDVDGITKYENLVEPQDGDLLSPKTGC